MTQVRHRAPPPAASEQSMATVHLRPCWPELCALLHVLECWNLHAVIHVLACAHTHADTMEPLYQNEGFAKSLEIYRRLARLNPLFTPKWDSADPGCVGGLNAFMAGKCLFTVQNSLVLKQTLAKPLVSTRGSCMPGLNWAGHGQSPSWA